MKVKGEYDIVTKNIHNQVLLHTANRATVSKQSAIKLLTKKAKELNILEQFLLIFTEEAWAYKKGGAYVISLPIRDIFLEEKNRYRLGLIFHELAHIIVFMKYPNKEVNHGAEFIKTLEKLLENNSGYINKVFKLNQKRKK